MTKKDIFNKAEEYANTNFPQKAENNVKNDVALHSFIDGVNWFAKAILKEGVGHQLRCKQFNLEEYLDKPYMELSTRNCEKIVSIEINEDDEDFPVTVTNERGHRWCCDENGKVFPEDITSSEHDIWVTNWNFLDKE